MDLISKNALAHSNNQIAFGSHYKGVRRMSTSKSDIDLFYAEGGLIAEGKEFHPNEYCIMTSEEKSSAVCKFNHKSKRLEPLLAQKRDIWGIQPLNVEQKCAVDLLLRDDIKLVSLVGRAGTGKTLLALACALKLVFDENAYRRILVSRPIMPLGRDIGYLPGSKDEKLIHWMQPIYDNLDFLCETSGSSMGSETKNWIMESGKIEMEAVTYIRGRSLSKALIIIDEAQNLTPHEMKTILSRAGHGTKVILTGDPTQIDNHKLDEFTNGLSHVVHRLKKHALYGHVYLEKTERSDLAAMAIDNL